MDYSLEFVVIYCTTHGLILKEWVATTWCWNNRALSTWAYGKCVCRRPTQAQRDFGSLMLVARDIRDQITRGCLRGNAFRCISLPCAVCSVCCVPVTQRANEVNDSSMNFLQRSLINLCDRSFLPWCKSSWFLPFSIWVHRPDYLACLCFIPSASITNQLECTFIVTFSCSCKAKQWVISIGHYEWSMDQNWPTGHRWWRHEAGCCMSLCIAGMEWSLYIVL